VGDLEAAHQLVRANLRFVVGLAMKYRGYGLRLEDLIEEGNVGLVVALRKYDPERGLRFITYAAYWVRAFMLQYVLRSWSLVGIGSSPLAHKLFFRLQRERARLSAQGETEEDAGVSGALAEHFQTSEQRIEEAAGRLDHRDVSLDAASFGGEGASPIELLRDDGPGPEEILYASQRDQLVRRRLDQVMGRLNDREYYILSHRLLDEDERLTLAEIGERLGISRERVRQLEDRVRAKLRHQLSDLQSLAAAA
jgi:RNA polymerase sigma-32 factor